MTLKEFLAVFTVNDPVAGRALNTTTNGGVDSLSDLLTLSDPSGGRAIKIAISGGVTKFWTEAYNSGTQATSSWTATGAATNINAAIVPKGTGALLASIPDGTTVGGNARGQYSVDFQMSRTAADQVASGNYNFIGSGQQNKAENFNNGIVSGLNNRITGAPSFYPNSYSFIGSGENNNLQSRWGVICGGINNTVANNTVLQVVIGGGTSNTITTGNQNFIGAGNTNTINNGAFGNGVIVGGTSNSVTGTYASVVGGQTNTASGTHSTVSGGQSNTASTNHSVVGGGSSNSISAGPQNVIGGGGSNSIGSDNSGGNTIAGGQSNVLGGTNNTVGRTIGGGIRNSINAEQTPNTTICGGVGNTIYFGSAGGFIGGGGNAAFPGGNFLCGTNSVLVGGQANYVGDGAGNGYSTYCFLGGGGGNDIKRECDYSVITGGQNNTINQAVDYGIITGGYQGVVSLYGQQAHASGRFAANGDAQAHELIWRRAITGTAQTELFLDGASVAAVLPGTNSIWQGTVDIAAVCTTTGDGSTIVGHVAATSYKVTIKRIGTTTSLVGAVQEIGTTNADGSMATSVITIDNNDTNESLRIRFTPPGTAGSTTVIRVVATFRGLQIQY